MPTAEAIRRPCISTGVQVRTQLFAIMPVRKFTTLQCCAVPPTWRR